MDGLHGKEAGSQLKQLFWAGCRSHWARFSGWRCRRVDEMIAVGLAGLKTHDSAWEERCIVWEPSQMLLRPCQCLPGRMLM